MKLFAIDMDGTLLNDDNNISNQQTEYLIDLIKTKNHKVVISTGRLVDGIKNILPKELYDLVYVIALNGGIILDKNNNIIQTNPMEKNQIDSIFKHFNKFINKLAVLNETSYYSFSNYRTDKYMKHESFLNKVELKKISKSNLINFNVLKIVYFFNPKEKSEVEIFVKNFNSEGLNLIYSQPYLLELLPSSVHKGAALKFLADHLDIKIEDVISFGDGMNDLTLMKDSGVAVAMENAVKEIKELSDYVTKSNNNDGVMFGIQKILKEI